MIYLKLKTFNVRIDKGELNSVLRKIDDRDFCAYF